MARTNLDSVKELARADYLSADDMTFQQLADKYGITRATVSRWAEKEGWKALKASKIVSKSKSVRNAYTLLDHLMQKAVDMAAAGEDTAKIVNEISQINKTLESLTGEVPLDTVINILDEFLDSVPHGHKTDAKMFKTDRELMASYQSDFLIKRAKKMSVA